LKTSKFNKLLREYNTDYYSNRAICEAYYVYITMRILRRYGSQELGETVAQEFFEKLSDLEVEEYIKYPAIWIHDTCDDIIKENHKEYAERENENINDFCQFAFGEQHKNIEKLGLITKLIVIMKNCEGYSFREIAHALYMSLKEVMEKYSNALKVANG